MTKPTDEMLMAYADGALNAEQTLAVEAWLAEHAEDRAAVAAFRRTAALAKAAYRQEVDDTPPSHLVDLIMSAPLGRKAEQIAEALSPSGPPLRGQGKGDAVDEAASEKVVPFKPRSKATAQSRWPSNPMPRFALPIAASVLLAIGVGLFSWGNGDLRDDDRLMRLAVGLVGGQTELATILNTKPSGIPAVLQGNGDEHIMVVGSFRDDKGRLCREVEQLAGPTEPVAVLAAVACRLDGQAWSVEGVFNVTSADNTPSGYVPSGTSERDALEGLLNILGASEMLDAEEERKLIANGWTK